MEAGASQDAFLGAVGVSSISLPANSYRCDLQLKNSAYVPLSQATVGLCIGVVYAAALAARFATL